MKFEVREIDAWGNRVDGYEWNTSFYMGVFCTSAGSAKGEKRAFCNFLKKRGIVFKANRTLIESDGFCYEIIDRKTKEPLFCAIPMEA